jgi:hypothetical protein
MKISSSRCRGPTAAAVFVVLVVTGCASQGAGDSAVESPLEREPLEVACEVALIELKALIDERAADAAFSRAALGEAMALYQVGTEFYLEGEYDLALELIEQAFDVLKEDGD